MVEVIKCVLKQLLNDLDSGNSSISEKEQEELLQLYEKISRKELNKTEASDYLGISTGTLNNYINRGWIPEGIKKRGSSQKVWFKSDLDKFLSK